MPSDLIVVTCCRTFLVKNISPDNVVTHQENYFSLCAALHNVQVILGEITHGLSMICLIQIMNSTLKRSFSLKYFRSRVRSLEKIIRRTRQTI